MGLERFNELKQGMLSKTGLANLAEMILNLQKTNPRASCERALGTVRGWLQRQISRSNSTTLSNFKVWNSWITVEEREDLDLLHLKQTLDGCDGVNEVVVDADQVLVEQMRMMSQWGDSQGAYEELVNVNQTQKSFLMMSHCGDFNEAHEELVLVNECFVGDQEVVLFDQIVFPLPPLIPRMNHCENVLTLYHQEEVNSDISKDTVEDYLSITMVDWYSLHPKVGASYKDLFVVELFHVKLENSSFFTVDRGKQLTC